MVADYVAAVMVSQQFSLRLHANRVSNKRRYWSVTARCDVLVFNGVVEAFSVQLQHLF